MRQTRERENLSQEQLAAKLQLAGLNITQKAVSRMETGTRVIADYELPFDVHSDMPLWEINANCRMVLEMEGTPIGNEMKAIQQKWFASFDEFIDHKDEIRYYDVGDGAALAEYLIREESIFGEIPHELLKHIDYHSYGSELEMDDRYLFTTSGVFRYQ